MQNREITVPNCPHLNQIENFENSFLVCRDCGLEVQQIYCNPPLWSSDEKWFNERSFFKTYAEFFEWSRPKAGSVGFVKFKGPFSSEELGSQLAKAGISIKPAYVFADNTESFDQYFRIGFGESKMPQTLNALTKFVEVTPIYFYK